MVKIKIKTFSKHKILDVKDFYKKVYKHLLKTNQGFCFLENGQLVSREMCCEIISN